MNWKLLFQLSLFGLIMAFATVSLVPQAIEPIFWLVIFIFCGVVIAKAAPGNYFLHGFFLSIINSVWITGVHVLMYASYVAHHPDVAKMYADLPPVMAIHPRLVTLLIGIVSGVVFGLIQGLVAFIASKIVKK